jgi:hypothetical protein
MSFISKWTAFKDLVACHGSKGLSISDAILQLKLSPVLVRLLLSKVTSLHDWRLLQGGQRITSLTEVYLNFNFVTVVAPMCEMLKAYGITQDEEIIQHHPQSFQILEVIATSGDRGCTMMELSTALPDFQLNLIIDYVVNIGLVIKQFIRPEANRTTSSSNKGITRIAIYHLRRFASSYDPSKFNMQFSVDLDNRHILYDHILQFLADAPAGIMSCQEVAARLNISGKQMIAIRDSAKREARRGDCPIVFFEQGTPTNSRHSPKFTERSVWYIRSNSTMKDSRSNGNSIKKKTSLLFQEDNSDNDSQSSRMNNNDIQHEEETEDEDDDEDSGDVGKESCLNLSVYGQGEFHFLRRGSLGLGTSDIRRLIGLPMKPSRFLDELSEVLHASTRKIQRGKQASLKIFPTFNDNKAECIEDIKDNILSSKVKKKVVLEEQDTIITVSNNEQNNILESNSLNKEEQTILDISQGMDITINNSISPVPSTGSSYNNRATGQRMGTLTDLQIRRRNLVISLIEAGDGLIMCPGVLSMTDTIRSVRRIEAEDINLSDHIMDGKSMKRLVDIMVIRGEIFRITASLPNQLKFMGKNTIEVLVSAKVSSETRISLLKTYFSLLVNQIQIKSSVSMRMTTNNHENNDVLEPVIKKSRRSNMNKSMFMNDTILDDDDEGNDVSVEQDDRRNHKRKRKSSQIISRNEDHHSIDFSTQNNNDINSFKSIHSTNKLQKIQQEDMKRKEMETEDNNLINKERETQHGKKGETNKPSNERSSDKTSSKRYSKMKANSKDEDDEEVSRLNFHFSFAD